MALSLRVQRGPLAATYGAATLKPKILEDARSSVFCVNACVLAKGVADT